MKFIWDSEKSKINLSKHNISFDEAKTVFSDPFARVVFDTEHSVDEERFIILGLSALLKILIVCYCHRENDTIRIISARKADKKEQRDYVRLK